MYIITEGEVCAHVKTHCNALLAHILAFTEIKLAGFLTAHTNMHYDCVLSANKLSVLYTCMSSCLRAVLYRLICENFCAHLHCTINYISIVCKILFEYFDCKNYPIYN